MKPDVQNQFLETSSAFKKCSSCNFEWTTRNDFLRDPNVEIIGYQAHLKELSAGLFLFNHSCKSTIAIRAGSFTDLYSGPMFTESITGSKICPGHCLHPSELRPCPNHCECAYVREIIHLIKEWPKQ